MKSILSVLLAVFFVVRCTYQKTPTEKDNLLNSNIPDLSYFNSNNVLINDTIFLVNKNDTISSYSYDSLGRYCYYNYKKMWSRKEYINYFGITPYPIYKRIKVDYSSSYLSSLVKIGNDTIKSFWYYEFGEIQDTFQYVFNKNKIKEIISSSLNDYEKLKLKRTFFYNSEGLKKIIALPVNGEKTRFGKLDSIITIYEYNGKITSKIIEQLYCNNKDFNHKNIYFFDDKGFPNRIILRDTMDMDVQLKIDIKKQ